MKEKGNQSSLDGKAKAGCGASCIPMELCWEELEAADAGTRSPETWYLIML